jgi:hypothetical protein
MTPWWLLSYVILWLALLFLGFLLLGALRALALLRWRLEQLEAITPTRIGRGGLKPGKKAPDFTLPSAAATCRCWWSTTESRRRPGGGPTRRTRRSRCWRSSSSPFPLVRPGIGCFGHIDTRRQVDVRCALRSAPPRVG